MNLCKLSTSAVALSLLFFNGYSMNQVDFKKTTNNDNCGIVSTDNDVFLDAKLKNLDEGTLVIFDCDDVLVTPVDLALSACNVGRSVTLLFKYLTSDKKFTPDKALALIDEIRAQMKWELMNDDLPQTINYLQSNGVHVMVLTAHQTGEDYNGKIHEDIRKAELKELGFDFKKSWPDVDKFTFEEFAEESNPTEQYSIPLPVFDDGIIFSCDFDKGAVLKAFLKRSPNLKFSKIIFVDDRQDNAESVAVACTEMNIPYYCIVYRKGELRQTKQPDFEEIKPRVDHLIATGKWG